MPQFAKHNRLASTLRGFTLVEVLVVIAIIGALMAILLPAVMGARRSGDKTRELNNLRQVAVGWSMYSEYSNNRLMPGYLEPAVQTAWNVTYKARYDDSDVPTADAASYPWRLLPYLDNNHLLLRDYVDSPAKDPTAAFTAIANEPAFGYNANYVGGWFENVEPNGRPVVRFEASNVIARTTSSVRDSTNLVIFASSASRNAGVQFSDVNANIAGSHFVVPSTVAMTPQWQPVGGSIEVLQNTSIPIMRYTQQIATVYADGHTAGETGNSLVDQRKWITNANTADFTHLP